MVLSFLHTLRTVLHKHNLQGQEYKPDIQKNRITLNIHQIQLQLVQRSRIVFPVNLGITGQSGFYLQPVDKFRCLLSEFINILLTLRPGPHNAHIPL